MQVPKPDYRKQKKAKNNKMPTGEDICIYCGSNYAQTHEVYCGTGNRQISIKYGFQIKLCNGCHRMMQDKVTEYWEGQDQYWRLYFQIMQENKWMDEGFSKKQARKKWMQLIMWNYYGDVYES